MKITEVKPIVFGCVAENNPKYLGQALRLVKSLRWFGGELAEADFMLCVVDGLAPEYATEFERLAAKVRIVPRFSVKHANSNKLRFLQQDCLNEYRTVVLLDCDILIVKDPSVYLGTDSFAATLAGAPTVPTVLFRHIFDHFGLKMPRPVYRCMVQGERTIPYFNAGVLIFSADGLRGLVPGWIAYNTALIDRIDLLGDRSFYCEQASLSLAVAATGIQVDLLGNEMNFPYHVTWAVGRHRRSLARVDPFIIHYHWLADEYGLIVPSDFPKANARAEEFNRRLERDRGDRFNNRRFWEERYKTDPELGSGIGSRGPCREYKRAMLQKAVEEFRPRTVLDIGCGDMAVSSILPDTGYTGIDLSETVINRNRAEFPDRAFICGDFLEIRTERADLTICLDLLIHQGTAEVYRRMVGKIVEATAGVGIIAAYAEPPDSAGIVFFHEPLAETLRSYGVTNLTKIGGYRDVVVYRFTTSREPV